MEMLPYPRNTNVLDNPGFIHYKLEDYHGSVEFNKKLYNPAVATLVSANPVPVKRQPASYKVVFSRDIPVNRLQCIHGKILRAGYEKIGHLTKQHGNK